MPDYTPAEFLVCQCARIIEDRKTAFVGWGMPEIAGILAQRLYAPHTTFIYEYGAIGPRVLTPFDPLQMGTPRNNYKAMAWTSMNTVFSQASLGLIDYGFLGALQIDRYGNVNSTLLGGDHPHPGKRFAGAGGANAIASLCWRTVLVLLHEKRRFVERLDFVTTPGYLGGEGGRERAGLPRETGPYRVVTSKALFAFDEKTKVMKLIATAPEVTVDEVLSEMQFQPLVEERVEAMKPPTPQELKLLREDIDPDGVIIGKLKK